MNVYAYHTANVRPLSSVYTQDRDVVLDYINEYTGQGLDVNFTTALSTAEDVKTNQHNTLFLTDQKKSENFVTVAPAKSEYPIYRQTYLKLSGTDLFWVIQQSTGTTVVSGTSGAIANPYFFELELLSPLYCSIRHYDNTTLKFLTLNNSNSAALTFTSRVSADAYFRDTQIFRYVLDDDNNRITLFQKLSTPLPGDAAGLTYNFIINKFGNSSSTTANGISASPINTTDTTPFSAINVFEIRPIVKTPTEFEMKSSWVSYLSSIREGSTLVDVNDSISNIENNYILSTQTDTVGFSSKEVDVNLFPLKNQLTVEGSTSKNNPYGEAAGEDTTTHRKYYKLHTGTYEEHGADSIYLSHISGVKELNFESDAVTYFHAPRDISPYTQVNISDTMLAKIGASPGSSPLKADKIFKQIKPVGNVIPKDEMNGTWLCAWLSGAGDSNVVPIWVDRFYNPTFASQAEALSAGLLSPVVYVDKVQSVTKTLGASANQVKVYDKASDLIIEPGILYAYHHIGKGNSQSSINSVKQLLLLEDLNIYKNFNGVHQRTTTDIDVRAGTHAMPGGALMTGLTHQSDSVNVPLVYSFDSDNYGVTDIITNTGSFTLNFWMWCKDWSAPFGDQLVGNYINKGFGIFNEPFVTPFILIPDGKRVHVFNSNYKYIDTHYIGRTIKHITRKGSSENFWIMDDSNDIYEYNINGVVLNKISSSNLTNKNVVDMDVSENNIYALIQPPMGSTTAQYFSYDLTNQTTGYAGTLATENVWNPSIGTGSSIYRIHSVKQGLSAGQGVVITRQESLSSDSVEFNALTGTVVFGSGSTIDIYGSPWAVQYTTVESNIIPAIYTYDRALSANIFALSAQHIIEGVQSDKHGNVWVLHDFNKVSKLDNDRKLLFTSTLTAVIPVSSVKYNRYCDFVHEFNDSGYDEHFTIIHQSTSGCKAVNMNTDGSVKSYTTVLTGNSLTQTDIVTFFNTPMVSSQALSAFSWKTVTGFDYLKKHKLNITPRIDARIALSNVYNSSTSTHSYSGYTLTVGTSSLGRGWHNFTILLDAEIGQYRMYVDAHLVDFVTFPPSKFSFADIFDQPLTVGSSPYFTKLILGEHLQQPQHYLANGMRIKNLKLYSKPLEYYDILSHYTVVRDTNDIKWDIPTGERNYIDTVERVFKHKIPGRKSSDIDINIKNTNLTDGDLKDDIRDKIIASLNKVLPVTTNVRYFGWDGVYTTPTTGADLGSSISVVTPAQPSTSTTYETQAGGTISYGY